MSFSLMHSRYFQWMEYSRVWLSSVTKHLVAPTALVVVQCPDICCYWMLLWQPQLSNSICPVVEFFWSQNNWKGAKHLKNIHLIIFMTNQLWICRASEMHPSSLFSQINFYIQWFCSSGNCPVVLYSQHKELDRRILLQMCCYHPVAGGKNNGLSVCVILWLWCCHSWDATVAAVQLPSLRQTSNPQTQPPEPEELLPRRSTGQTNQQNARLNQDLSEQLALALGSGRQQQCNKNNFFRKGGCSTPFWPLVISGSSVHARGCPFLEPKPRFISL